MAKDNQRSIRTSNAGRQQLSTFTRALDLINASGISAAMRLMQSQQAVVSKALLSAGSPVSYNDLLKATQQMHELSLPTTTGFNALSSVHHSWLSKLSHLSKSSVQFESIAKLALSDISYNLTVIEPRMSKINFADLGRQLDIQQPVMSAIEHSMSNFMASHRLLVESIQDIDDLVKLPSFVLPGASRELASTGHCLDVLYPPANQTQTSDEEIEAYPTIEGGLEGSDLVDLLKRVDPDLSIMFMGAVSALNGHNQDRSRHVLVSLRELRNQLLRRLAPKEELAQWIIGQANQSYIYEGKPTRRAKIMYALREVDNEPLRGFIEADVDAAIKLFKLYDRLHEKKVGVTDDQLRAIFIRSRSLWEYLLKTYY